MKKLWIACICCCLCVGTAYAKDVYYEKFTDSKTGRQIEYFDLNEDTTRTYFTQNAWFSDSKSFIITSKPEQQIYKYDILSHSVTALFSPACLPLDNAAVVGPDDTVYAVNHTDGNLYAQKVTGEEEEQEEIDVLSMTLPFLDNYTTDETHTADEGTDYTENGLTLRLNNVNRYRDVVTVARQRGGKWCRATVCQRRSGSGELWTDYYSYDWTQKSSHMSYTVDNSRISADTRNVTIEFDYYDDSDSELSGKSIEIKYLKYNNGGTPTVGTKTVAITGTNTWKTARVDLTDAQFDKSSALVSDGRNYDFRIGIGYNRGGFASTWIKVYPTPTSNVGEVSFEVDSSGTSNIGLLPISIWNSYDRDIGYSGTDGKSAIDGKHYVYNREFTGTPDWKRWKNAFFFNVPDSFVYGTNYQNVEIEVECYLTAGSLQLDFGNNNSITKTVPFNQWTTIGFSVSPSGGYSFSNGLDGSDFRLYSTGCSGYIHKVTVRKSSIANLGSKQGGWHPHVSINGDLSLTTGDKEKIVIYEANNRKFATTDVWIKSSHAIINPMYPHLVLYCEDGNTSDTTNARIRVFNRNTMYKGALFVQYKNSSGGETTGEAVGHESWSGNGEYVVAVKYVKDTNVGKNGIIRMDKNGENREYINDDYDYWHCAANYDGRWIVADTEPVSDITNIVLIDAKTGKSYLIARQKTSLDEDGQSHPTFSPDGTKITFGIARRKLNSSDENYVKGAAMVDVSDIVNDGQIAEPVGPTDFLVSPFEIGFNKDLGRNEVRAAVDNIDGETRDMTLYAAVYDENGKMISANKSRYNSSADETIATEIEDADKGQTLRCFLWDDDKTPIKNSTDTIRQLHAAKVGANEIVLSWQHETDVPVLKYEVYRGNQKIGETVDTIYRDSGLTKETQYTYYVRPVYKSLSIGADGEFVTAGIDEFGFDGLYSVLGRPSKNHGLTFFENDNLALDSYTEFKVQDGESCRMARQVLEGETDEAGNKRWGSTYDGMFYFKCDRDAVTADTNNVLIGVKYYDNREGVTLSLNYKNTSGSTSTKQIVTKTGTNTWKTATVVLDDAKFIDSSEFSGYDFRFQGGYSMYISRVWVIPLDSNGNRVTANNVTSGNQIAGDKAGVKVTTTGETISALLQENVITENGLHFILNNDSSRDGYSVPKYTDNKSCRQLTSDSTSMLCFKVDKNIIPEDVTSVDVTVEYYGYNYNGGKIQLYYTATDGTTKTKDVATPSSSSWSSSGKQWKTATVSVTDAKLNLGLNRYSDFLIKATKSGIQIASVTVTKKSTPAASAHQSVEWTTSTGEGSGLSRISGGTINGDLIWVNSPTDWLKFSVDDTYMSGKSDNMAWVEITYKDSGTSKIYLYYNTSDPTASAPKADKQADTVITCTATGELKTAVIPVIDANFSNYDGYDFRIGTDNGVSIKKVRVVGY